MSIVSGNIWTSDRVESLSTNSAVTLPQSEEISTRSCAIADPIDPSVMTKALKSSFAVEWINAIRYDSSVFTHLLRFCGRGAE
jgi:hypothetical protein